MRGVLMVFLGLMMMRRAKGRAATYLVETVEARPLKRSQIDQDPFEQYADLIQGNITIQSWLDHSACLRIYIKRQTVYVSEVIDK